MLREQANLPALYPQGKNVQRKFVVYFLFWGGGGGTLPVPLTKEMVTWIKHYTSLLMVFIYFFFVPEFDVCNAKKQIHKHIYIYND